MGRLLLVSTLSWGVVGVGAFPLLAIVLSLTTTMNLYEGPLYRFVSMLSWQSGMHCAIGALWGILFAAPFYLIGLRSDRPIEQRFILLQVIGGALGGVEGFLLQTLWYDDEPLVKAVTGVWFAVQGALLGIWLANSLFVRAHDSSHLTRILLPNSFKALLSYVTVSMMTSLVCGLYGLPMLLADHLRSGYGGSLLGPNSLAVCAQVSGVAGVWFGFWSFAIASRAIKPVRRSSVLSAGEVARSAELLGGFCAIILSVLLWTNLGQWFAGALPGTTRSFGAGIGALVGLGVGGGTVMGTMLVIRLTHLFPSL